MFLKHHLGIDAMELRSPLRDSMSFTYFPIISASTAPFTFEKLTKDSGVVSIEYGHGFLTFSLPILLGSAAKLNICR
jgi:hypothetical protein